MNRLLCEHAAEDRYATMFWGHYQPSPTGIGTLRYVNAGHPPPLLVREGVVTRLEEGGPVLGLLPAATYEQGSVSFADGDLLVLYSDGIIEAANAQNEEFGMDRLSEIVARAGNLSADALRGQILEAVRTFSQGELADDRTLLILRREPAPRTAPATQAERQTVTV
jgi:sigma-B regulation protein RsbU (phosphoserine phosphatase)